MNYLPKDQGSRILSSKVEVSTVENFNCNTDNSNYPNSM